jgi:hypothetical protein
MFYGFLALLDTQFANYVVIKLEFIVYIFI